jgi:hypothetical protein
MMNNLNRYFYKYIRKNAKGEINVSPEKYLLIQLNY